jgi:hypothetical protein
MVAGDRVRAVGPCPGAAGRHHGAVMAVRGECELADGRGVRAAPGRAGRRAGHHPAVPGTVARILPWPLPRRADGAVAAGTVRQPRQRHRLPGGGPASRPRPPGRRGPLRAGGIGNGGTGADRRGQLSRCRDGGPAAGGAGRARPGGRAERLRAVVLLSSTAMLRLLQSYGCVLAARSRSSPSPAWRYCVRGSGCSACWALGPLAHGCAESVTERRAVSATPRG